MRLSATDKGKGFGKGFGNSKGNKGDKTDTGQCNFGKYYWRVLASDGTRQGLPSKIYGFTISETCPGRK